MSLSEIKEKLYNKEEGEKILNYDKVDFDARKIMVDAQKTDFVKKDEAWKEKGDVLKKERTKAVKIAGVAVAVIFFVAVVLVGFYFIRSASFSNDRVVVGISGLKDSPSGQLVNYEISYENNNRAALKNAILQISFPENFTPVGNENFKPEGRTGGIVQIGEIAGHGKGKYILSGKIYSPKGTMVFIKADLLFDPAGFDSRFVSSNQISIKVVSSSITLNFLASQNLSNGDSLDYFINYKNEGSEDFQNVKVKIDYPQGFTFSKSDPPVSESNNTWYIGHLSAGQEGRITISGKLEGAKDDIKLARAYIGEVSNNQFISQNEEKVETKIEASALTIRQTVNDLSNLTVNAGQDLRFKIFYKNEGSVGIRNVIVTEKLDSVVLDYTKLNLMANGGFFDVNNKTITWKAVDIPALGFLESGAEGSIEFSVKVKDIIPVNNAQDKNFVISSIAKVDSPDIPTPIQGNKIVSGNKMDMKLNSKLVLSVKGFYNDSFISNSGPIPPAVGKDTTYTIVWNVMNISSDVSGVKVEASLPTGVVMTGKIYPEDVEIKYNERTNGLTWDIGNLAAGTGILSAAKEVRFQVKINPSPNQENTEASILGPSTISGKDLFSDSNLSVTMDGKSSYLSEDTKIPGIGYKVVN